MKNIKLVTEMIKKVLKEDHAGFSNKDTRYTFMDLTDFLIEKFATKKIQPKPTDIEKLYKIAKTKPKKFTLIAMTDEGEVNFDEIAKRFVDDYRSYYKGHFDNK